MRTSQYERSVPAPDLLARARSIAPLFSQEAEKTEQLGTPTPSVVEALRDTELFWMIVPEELGGLGADVVTAIAVIEELSRADGSAGWAMMANCLSTGIAASYGSDDVVQAMFGAAQRPIMAGMLGPGGQCVPSDGGYVGSGRYAFGSGSGHADYLGAGMFVIEDGRQRLLPSGLPEVQVFIVPRAKVQMAGNWSVNGLVGTGSYDYVVEEQFLAGSTSFERTSLTPQRGGARYEMGLAGFGCAGHAAVALGLGARALEEIAKIAVNKRRAAYPSVVGDHALFRAGFSRHEAAYQCARAFVIDVFAEAEAVLARGDSLTALHRQRFRQAATYSHELIADVVRWCFQWGGSDALREPNALGRCLRDMNAATQHVFVDPITMVDAAGPLMAAWASVRA